MVDIAWKKQNTRTGTVDLTKPGTLYCRVKRIFLVGRKLNLGLLTDVQNPWDSAEN